jgi:hypothetical protein
VANFKPPPPPAPLSPTPATQAATQAALPPPAPFAFGQGQPFRDNTPWLGGWIRILPTPIAVTPNYQVAHGLKCVPRFCWVLDSGTTSYKSPPIRGTQAWTASYIYIDMPALVEEGQQVVLLIA